MIELEYFLVAESVSTDRDTNLVSVFNVLEELQGGGDGVVGAGVIPTLAAIGCFRVSGDGNPRHIPVQLVIHEPNAPNKTFALNAPVGKHRFRALFRLQGLAIRGNGDLTFELLLDGKHVAQHVVTVHRDITVTG